MEERTHPRVIGTLLPADRSLADGLVGHGKLRNFHRHASARICVACHDTLTSSFMCAGGLTENDFIMASKINALEVSDLMPKAKQRFWA